MARAKGRANAAWKGAPSRGLRRERVRSAPGTASETEPCAASKAEAASQSPRSRSALTHNTRPPPSARSPLFALRQHRGAPARSTGAVTSVLEPSRAASRPKARGKALRSISGSLSLLLLPSRFRQMNLSVSNECLPADNY